MSKINFLNTSQNVYSGLKEPKYNMHFIKEKSSKGNFIMMESYLNSWRYMNTNKNISFKSLLETVSDFKNNCKNKSQISKVVSILSEQVIPSIDNVKLFKNDINKINEAVIIESYNKQIVRNRVINNHKKLNNRNFDRLIREYNINDNNIDYCIYELCSLIDNCSSKMSTSAKFNVALENISYGFTKNNIPYNEETVLSNIADYFLSENVNYDCISMMSNHIQNSYLYDNENKQCLNYITNESVITEALSKDTIKDMLNKFKIEPKKTPEGLKSIVTKFYTLSADNVIEETPNFLSWFRKAIVFSTLAANLYLGIITIFVDKFIEMGVKRKEADKMVNKFKSELNKAKSKKDKLDRESKSYSNNEKYIKELEKNIDSLEQYRDSLYSEDELDARDNDLDSLIESYLKEESDEVPEDIKENIISILAIDKDVKEFDDQAFEEIMNIVDKDIPKYNNDILPIIVNISTIFPNLLSPTEVEMSYNNELDSVYKLSTPKLSDKYSRIDTLKEGIYDLSKVKRIKELEEQIPLSIVNETIKMIKDYHIHGDSSIFIENSVTNTLKLQGQKLKKDMVKLSDKEKIWSRQMDNALDRMRDKIEKDLSNKNREAVIKGRVLPSFSSIMKIVFTSGAASFLINPAMGAITALTGLALSKSATKKEKQFILDEIDIQLKMVEKKQQLAESNNDMKSLEQLLKIEQKLKREKKRILYNLKRYNDIMYKRDE